MTIDNDNSLPKSMRILQPKAFKQVYANRQFGNSRFFTFNALGDQQSLKLGITVAKKVSKLAVQRNRVKRLVREHFRHNKHRVGNTHLVITAKAGASSASNQELRDNLEELWVKVGRWQRWLNNQNKGQQESG